MGAVFLAEDTELRRNVALKFLPEYYTSKPDIKTRFKREAQAAAALNHPAIITVYEVGEYRDSSYIAMEYVEGKSLRDIIDAKNISFEKAIELISQVGDGLSFAHQHGIVHRDIKPENIMLDKYGRVKILDFGLAKYKGVTRITREGTTMGTPHYMSPEQVKGHELDQRSDIYSLGVVMYELLSGELPFAGQYEAAILYAIVNEEPTRISKHLPDISPALEKVIVKTLQKEVKSRYQSLEDFLADLKKEKQRPTKSYKPTVLLENHKPPKTKKKSPILIAAISALAVLALVFTLIFSGTFKSEKAPSKSPQQSSETITRPQENPPTNKQPINASTAAADRKVDVKPAAPKPKGSEVAAETKTTVTDAVTVGVLQITSTPSGASVLQNGRGVGKTPFENKNVKPGSYDIIVRLTGYADYAKSVNVAGGQIAKVDAIMTKAIPRIDAPVGVLQITSTPSGTSVLQDGRSIGKTPFENKNVKPGSYDIILRMNGYEDHAQSVRVTAGQTAMVSASLIKKAIVASEKPEPKIADIPTLPTTGAVKILVKPFGSIFVDGNLRQSDWQFQYREELPAGKHTIRAVHRTFGTWEKEMIIVAGKTIEVIVDFTKQIRVTVASTPWGEIYVDNQPTGFQTPKEITVRVGKRAIEVRRDGFETVGGARVINFENDLAQPLRFDLRKK